MTASRPEPPAIRSRSTALAKCGLFLAAFALFAASAASAADIDPTGKWVGIYSCANDSGNMRMTVAKESGVLLAVQTFSSPDTSGGIKMRLTTGPDGRVSLLPMERIGSWRGQMPTLTGSYSADGDSLSGTLSKCGENSAFLLAREKSAPVANAPSDDPRTPAPISGGPAQGHWKGQLTCKRNNRTPTETVPVEADMVQDGEGVAALFRLRINRKAGTSSEGVAGQFVILRGLWLEGRMNLSWPAILTDVSPAWRLLGLTVTFDADGRSASGTPKMKPCDAITLRKVGPAVTEGVPNEWAGLWLGAAAHTRSSVMFVPKADPALAELRTSYPVDRAPAKQDRMVAAMAPLYARDGKIVFVPLGARLGTGAFEHAEDYGAYGHIQAKARAFVVGMSGSDALSFRYIYNSSDLTRAFEATEGELDQTRDGLLLKKVDPAAATLMASGATPPMALGGGLGGALAKAATQEDQCNVLLAWAKPFGGEDGFDRHGIAVDEIMKRIAGAFADDVFVPVFGVPYAMFVREERLTIYDLLPRCGRTLGAKVLLDSTLKSTFATDLSQKWMGQRVVERAGALAWLAEKRKRIQALPDESASMDELKRLRKEAEQGLKALPEPERNQFEELAAARSADIEGVLLRRQVEEIAAAPAMGDALDRLVAAKRKIDKSDATPEAKRDLSREVTSKATTIAASLYAAAREKAASAPHSLDGLAALHGVRAAAERVAASLRQNFGVGPGDGLRPILAQEQAMLADTAIQSAFRDRMMKIEPAGDPFDAVREAASHYLDTDRLDDFSEPYAAYARAVQEAGARVELASVDFRDVSGMTSPDEPTARDMLLLVLQRVNDVNAGIRERERKCLARDFQNDPVLAMACLQIMTVTQGQGGFRVRLKSFSKLGCGRQGSNRFECQFETALANNSSMFMGELGRMFSTPGVQTALVVHNTDGSWTMIY